MTDKQGEPQKRRGWTSCHPFATTLEEVEEYHSKGIPFNMSRELCEKLALMELKGEVVLPAFCRGTRREP